MTTLQPRLVRADTYDLQSHNAPSAKDHTRSPTFSPYSHGPTGPHHREALRSAEESAYTESKLSPRLSEEGSRINSTNREPQYDSTDDDGEDEQQDGPNGVVHSDGDYDESNEENEDDLEDDLLDKISSSPSIEDGKYSPFIWPPRVDSIEFEASPASPSSMPTRGNISPILSSAFSISEPMETSNAHQVGHHLSESRRLNKEHGCPSHEMDPRRPTVNGASLDRITSTHSPRVIPEATPVSLNLGDIRHYLFPIDDPLLDDDLAECTYDDMDGDWVDEGEPWYDAESSSDDDSDDFQFSDDPRFLDSGWGGECLREIEDIDFEFVYALHTFVATVEGQANATKGDTMVLLDDSNSYWWLVRVVKDGSIGYLPAEHIETPTERLARLNKHRNIDLSASMLGDNPEKSKNPLKKAMRRRNAKTVAFTAPTYYEPSEIDYDSEDEDEQEVSDGVIAGQQQSIQQPETNTVHDASKDVEPQDSTIVSGTRPISGEDQISLNPVTAPVKTETPDTSVAQAQLDENLQRSRNGIVRNTDSFFKDDSVETKKISLTPRLLRNDTDATANSDQDLRSKTSSDMFDRVVGPEEKPKEKEKKEKKKGMLSGLFKRKDKSAKNAKSDVEDEKVDDTVRESQSKESSESISTPQSPERKSGKLQKSQPTAVVTPVVTPNSGPVEVVQPLNQVPVTKAPVQSQVQSPDASETVLVAVDSREVHNGTSAMASQTIHPEQTSRVSANSEKRSIFAPITTVLKSSPSVASEHAATVKPVYSKRAKERFAIDASDSEDDHTPTMSQTSREHRAVSPVRDSQLLDTRTDSAMAVSPVDQSDTDYSDHTPPRPRHASNHLVGTHEPALHHVHGTPQSDTASTSKPSPSLATHTPSTSRSTPTWSDASLRSYMDSDQDVRDLLIIVHDKSNVIPVGPDHPLMGGLFLTERTRLAEMQTQLDTMLTTWMSKKNPGLLAR